MGYYRKLLMDDEGWERLHCLFQGFGKAVLRPWGFLALLAVLLWLFVLVKLKTG